MAYGGRLTNKPVIVAMNKIDTLDEEECMFFQQELESLCGQKVYPLSAVSGYGVPEVLRALRIIINSTQTKEEEKVRADVTWQP